MSTQKVEKMVLAYSGGLDTSVMIHWLKKNYNCEVIAVCCDLGQSDFDAAALEKKALATGASKFYSIDAKKEFLEKYCFVAMQAGALYEGQYPLHTALGRPLIAKVLVDVAHKENATTVVHGCTGKGNDQVRIELGVSALDPKLKNLGPLRTWELKTRKQEIEYAQKHKIPVAASLDKPYSIDQNIWGVATSSGALESLEALLPENALSWVKPMSQWPKTAETLLIEFKEGAPVAVNGEKMDPVSLVKYLNEAGSRHGIGVIDMIENRVVGIKSREVYEVPGALILYSAYKKLEEILLDKDCFHYKFKVSDDFANLIYGGQWFTPLRSALQAFLNTLSKNITGSVKINLYQGKATAFSPQAKHSLYDMGLATYLEESGFNQQWAEGFIPIYGLPYKTLAKTQGVAQ